MAAAPTQLETMGPAPRLDTSARLNARVNPGGESLDYTFELSTDAGSTWQVLPSHTDGGGFSEPIVISHELKGLQPDTGYRFRVKVENASGAAVSDERSFTTRSTAEVTLPPRGYELVNTPNKGNQNVETPRGEADQEPMTADGNRVFWAVRGGAPGGYNGTGASFLAERTASGWKSRSVLPLPSLQVGGGDFVYRLDFHDDSLSSFIFDATRNTLFGSPSDTTFVHLDDQQNQAVLSTFPLDLSSNIVSASADGKHVFLVDNGGLSSTGKGNLVDIGSGTPEVVSIMPDGTPSDCLVRTGPGFGGRNAFTSVGGASNQVRSKVPLNMSSVTDGSIVYFQTPPNGACGEPEGLYVRDLMSDETTLIGPGAFGIDAEFIKATPNGRSALFLTAAQLAPGDANLTRDIYRWNHETKQTTCVTCLVPEVGIGTGFAEPRIIASDDLATVYFLSPKELIPGKGAGGGLYMLRDGQFRLVLPGGSFSLGLTQVSADGNLLVGPAVWRNGYTSDSVSSSCILIPGEPQPFCEQLMAYEAEEEALECVSCVRGGTSEWIAPGVSGFRIAADGRTIAFGTGDRLEPKDVNRTNDVYEWRSGVRRLVTDGTTDFPPFAATEGAQPLVRAVSGDGGTILYSAPEANRTGYEVDGLSNLYVARIGGGFERPNPPAHCSEESCQGPLVAAPVGRSPGSSVLNGEGNTTTKPRPRKCRKGKVRRHGKCVRKHKKKKGHHQRRATQRHGGRGK